jgi:hypothetical protein
VAVTDKTRALLQGHADEELKLAEKLTREGEGELAIKMFGHAVFLNEWLAQEARLSAAPKSRTLSEMAQAVAAEGPRRRGRPTKTKHPFPVALEKRGTTVAEWARANGLEREVVKSWFAPPPAGRRIPAVWAERIATELRIPASEAVWKNGIR